MKKVLFLAVAFVAGLGVMAQDKTEQLVKLNADSYNFGKIKQAVPVTTYFEIKNISNKPIVVESATAGCGCTTPEVTKEPIAPGASAKLKVGYNAAAMGHFDKPVTIRIAGASDAKQIMITGDVLDAAAYDEYAKSEEYKKSQTVTETKTKVKVSANEKTTKTKKKEKSSSK